MTMNLNTRAWLSVAVLAGIMGLALFGAAGTLRYWEGWAYMALFFSAAAITTVHLMRADPALLERRMAGGPIAEQRSTQKVVMLCLSAGFIALLAVPGLDHRFTWSRVPFYGALGGDVLVALGMFFIFLVYRANTFSSATIEVAADQTVISTGPYAIVRHPMYAGASVYMIGTPLALGSYWGLVALAAILPCLVWRLLDEERFLGNSLAGYAEYRQRVQYRLIPGVF